MFRGGGGGGGNKVYYGRCENSASRPSNFPSFNFHQLQSQTLPTFSHASTRGQRGEKGERPRAIDRPFQKSWKEENTVD